MISGVTVSRVVGRCIGVNCVQAWTEYRSRVNCIMLAMYVDLTPHLKNVSTGELLQVFLGRIPEAKIHVHWGSCMIEGCCTRTAGLSVCSPMQTTPPIVEPFEFHRNFVNQSRSVILADIHAIWWSKLSKIYYYLAPESPIIQLLL